MDFGRTQSVIVLSSEFLDSEFIKESLKVLEVRHVASSTDNSILANCMQTLNIFEPCK